MTYTLEDLEKAKETLALLEDRDSNDTSGNPEKYHTKIATARQEVYQMEKALKASGGIPRTNHEQIEQELDDAFPKASSRQVVELKGERYQRLFQPLTKSRSGKTVTSWRAYWLKLEDK